MRKFLIFALCIISLVGCAKSVPVEMEWITLAPDDPGTAYAALVTDDRPLILNELFPKVLKNDAHIICTDVWSLRGLF
jgi:hypothetical protein